MNQNKYNVCQPMLSSSCHSSTSVQPLRNIDEKYENNKNSLDVLDIENKEIKNIISQIKPNFILSRMYNTFLSTTEIQTYKKSFLTIVAQLIMADIENVMNTFGYSNCFKFQNNEYDVFPPEIAKWNIDGKNIEFVNFGKYLFWKKNICSSDNIFIEINFDGPYQSTLSIITTNQQKCIELLDKIEKYTKQKNILQHTCLKDLDMVGNFKTLEFSSNYSFDNYYYEDNINEFCAKEIVHFVQNIDIYQNIGISKRGFLLYGDPGSGKTSLNKIISKNIKNYATVLWITPDVLSANAYGQTLGHSLHNIYLIAEFLTPCLIIYEDIDLIAGDRYAGGGNMSLGTLMNFLDGINTVSKVVTLATTNRLDLIEDAIRNRPGRFDRIIEVPKLNSTLRKRMFISKLNDWEDVNKYVDYLVEKTRGKQDKGWSGAEIQELINTLNIQRLNNENQKQLDKHVIDKSLNIMSSCGIQATKEKKSIGFCS